MGGDGVLAGDSGRGRTGVGCFLTTMREPVSAGGGAGGGGAMRGVVNMFRSSSMLDGGAEIVMMGRPPEATVPLLRLLNSDEVDFCVRRWRVAAVGMADAAFEGPGMFPE